MLMDISWSGWSLSTLAMTALAGLLATNYFIWRFSRFVRLIDALPGPKPLPVLGNLLHFVNFSFDEMLVSLGRENPIYKLWISYYPVVFIAHPELWKSILLSNANLTRPHEYNFIFPEDTLIALKDESWRGRRRLMNPAFHHQILSGFIDTFNEISIDYVSKMEEILEATDGCKEIDVFPIMSELVLHILHETLLGEKVVDEEELTNFVKGLKRLEYIFMERTLHKPWLRMDWIFKWSSLYRQQMQLESASKVTFNKVIQIHREMALKQPAEKCQSDSHNIEEEEEYSRANEKLAFLDLLLKAKAEENSELNDEILLNEVCTFMAAGLDTTAVVFTWFLYVIAKQPEHQKLVMEELDLIFGDSHRPVTAHDLTELKYLECCIKETMRMYPPIPIISRYLTEEVLAGDYTLPKGITVSLNIYSVHHNQEVFPDPESFKPERFFPENSIGRHPYAFVPFSSGPRNCIGQKYAMMELKICLANILRRLKFSHCDPSGPLQTPSLHLALKPKNDQCFLIVSK